MVDSPIIKKTSCEKYNIRLPNLNGWANICLSEDDGAISIISDYGNWGYIWNHRGEGVTLKKFLTQIDSWYAWNKFTGSKKEYNHERTIKELKAAVLQRFVDENISDTVMYELDYELDRIAEEGDDRSLCDSYLLGEHFESIYEHLC